MALLIGCNPSTNLVEENEPEKITATNVIEITSTPNPVVNQAPNNQPTTEAEFTVESGVIAFTSYTSESLNFNVIFLIEPSNPEAPAILTSSPNDYHTAWSPDGKRVAFTSERDGNWEVYILNSDGTNQVRLTTNLANDISPAWSPNGRKIAFISDQSGNDEIFVIGSDGSSPKQVTDIFGDKKSCSWSPDGDSIVFDSNFDGDWEIYSMQFDDQNKWTFTDDDMFGPNMSKLTDNNFYDMFPTWSPDGHQIAFMSADLNWDVFIMNTNGTGSTNITNSQFEEYFPSWSPTGQQLAFISDRNGQPDIYITDRNGKNILQITNSQEEEFFPRWSPETVSISDEPFISPAWCARDADKDGWPEEPTSTFVTNDDLPYVVFFYRNMKNGMDFSNIWSFETGSISPNIVSIWDSGEAGVGYVECIMTKSRSGKFTVQLSVEDKLLQEVECEIVE